jgi:hypothetical protein
MLKILDGTTAATVVVECGGKLTTDDYATLGKALDDAVEAAGETKPSMVFYMTSSPMDADWDAVKDDAKFGLGQYRELARVAYVGDIKWVDWVVKAFGWMTKAEERTFPADRLDDAIAWAGGDTTRGT